MADGIRVYCERPQILRGGVHAIVAPLVAMKQGGIAARIDPFSVARDPPALRDVVHGRASVERGRRDPSLDPRRARRHEIKMKGIL
ncbi:hypothetical protein BCEP4_600015 [Burkholderia cepacia]|nr:hypothetical protein BCEP4_600015 [Burkholderia cepacia]